MARVQEAVNIQVKAIDQLSTSAQVNVVSFGKSHRKGKGNGAAQIRGRGNKPGKHCGGSREAKVMNCFRCNYTWHVTRIHVGKLDILLSVAKVRNANLQLEILNQGKPQGAEHISCQKIQPLVHKIIMLLQLELVSLEVV